MSDQLPYPTCPDCGDPLPPDSPQALCPACLMRQALASRTIADGGKRAAVATPPTPAEIADSFPGFEILECLGRGGMGVVYKARQKSLDRLVAIKILPPERVGEEKFAERFAREAQTLARLSHPNIVTVFDYGQTGGLFYIVMEFVDGVNLRDLLRDGKLEPNQALAIIPPICDALQFAHDKGIVHRDIKPENLLLDKDGRVKIADFGIAKLMDDAAPDGGIATPAGKEPQRLEQDDTLKAGTRGYAAPEQSCGPVDHRADIYALGVVLYEMLTGERPEKEAVAPSRKVQLDVRIDEIVLRAMEKTPELRYQTAREFRTVLQTVSGELGSGVTATTSATPGGTSPIPPDEARVLSPDQRSNLRSAMSPGNKAILIGCGVLLASFAVLAMVAMVGFFFFFFQRPVAREPAQREGTAAVKHASQLTQEGWQLWQAQRWSEAATKFEGAVELSPADANAWNGLGWAQFNAGRNAPAEQAFIKAVGIDPNQPGALNGLGQIYLSQRKYDDAEKFLLQAAPQAPAAWFGLARLYLLQGNFPDAESWAQKIVDSGHADDTARKMLEAAKARKLSVELRRFIEPPAAEQSKAGVSAMDQAVREVARKLVAAMRAGDDAAMQANACDLIAGWRDAMPAFAKELRGKLQELVGGTEPLEKIDGVFVDGDFAAVKTAKVEKAGACLILFFANTTDGWRNWSLRNAPIDAVLDDCLGKEVATLDGAFKKRGHAFVDLLAAGKFSGATARFADVMRNAMPEAKLAGLWHQLETTGGKFLAADPATRIERNAGFFCVYVPCRWERNQLDLKVVFDLAGNVSGLWIVPASGSDAASRPAAEAEKSSAAAAQDWLSLVDGGKYVESWKSASGLFQGGVSETAWINSMETFRKPLGNLLSRKMTSARLVKEMPGAPDGSYVVMQFDSSFAEKKSAVETVTFRLEKDGRWKAAGYFIK